MAGFDLKSGNFIEAMTSEDELWSALCGTFSSKASHDTTYKYGFMKAILDNLYNVDASYVLTFDQLFSKFAEVYWNLVLKYEIRQKAPAKGKRGSAIETVLQDAKDEFGLNEVIPFESLPESMKATICKRVKQKCKQNVVGALFADTRSLFYGFDVKEQWIKLNPAMYEFLCKHKVFVEKVNYFEWASFLEKVNDEAQTMHLLSKLDESAKRNNLAPYRQILFNEFEQRRCFYCGRPLNEESAHVDHFVPWSFIKDDKLWNFVLACPACNISKSDKLPVTPYLTTLEGRNDDLNRRGVNLEMGSYRQERLRNVYGWAQANGYDTLWYPKGKKPYPMISEDYGTLQVAEEQAEYGV